MSTFGLLLLESCMSPAHFSWRKFHKTIKGFECKFNCSAFRATVNHRVTPSLLQLLVATVYRTDLLYEEV